MGALLPKKFKKLIKEKKYHMIFFIFSIMSSKVITVNNLTHYLQLLEKEKRVVVVDFSAHWCGPCKKLAPILDQLSTKYCNLLLILKVDVDQEDKLDQEEKISPLFSVHSLPTMVFIKDCQFQQGDDFRIEGLNVNKLMTVLKTLTGGQVQQM